MSEHCRPRAMTRVVDRLHAAGCVFAEREAAVLAQAFLDPVALEAAATRRCSGEPLEYVVGVAEFAGITVEVGPPVFIPRRRAEALIEVASECFGGDEARRVAVDLGCGSGALAAALRSRHPHWRVVACDADVAALAWAARNGARYGFETRRGDWFEALPATLRRAVDLVVAHLPYVPTGELRSLPRDFLTEPAAAVDGGPDGLEPWREVAARASDWLRPDGTLLLQVAGSQVPTATKIARRSGLSATAVETDDAVVLVVRPQAQREQR